MNKQLNLTALISSLVLLGIFVFNQVLLAHGPTGPAYQTDWIAPESDDSLLHGIVARCHPHAPHGQLPQPDFGLQLLPPY